MPFSLLPKVQYPALTAIAPEALQKSGIALLMLDFDNTIVPYTTDVPTAEMEAWLQKAQASGLTVCVVSNSKKPRVQKFCAARGIPCFTHARKPFPKGIRACMAHYGLEPRQCALCGDQIFTDVLGANCAGVRSLLIPAIHNHNIWLKLRHLLEIPFIFLARGRRVF